MAYYDEEESMDEARRIAAYRMAVEGWRIYRQDDIAAAIDYACDAGHTAAKLNREMTWMEKIAMIDLLLDQTFMEIKADQGDDLMETLAEDIHQRLSAPIRKPIGSDWKP